MLRRQSSRIGTTDSQRETDRLPVLAEVGWFVGCCKASAAVVVVGAPCRRGGRGGVTERWGPRWGWVKPREGEGGHLTRLVALRRQVIAVAADNVAVAVDEFVVVDELVACAVLVPFDLVADNGISVVAVGRAGAELLARFAAEQTAVTRHVRQQHLLALLRVAAAAVVAVVAVAVVAVVVAIVAVEAAESFVVAEV